MGLTRGKERTTIILDAPTRFLRPLLHSFSRNLTTRKVRTETTSTRMQRNPYADSSTKAGSGQSAGIWQAMDLSGHVNRDGTHILIRRERRIFHASIL